MSITDANPVEEYSTAIKAALSKAHEAQPSGEIEPVLASHLLEECIGIIESAIQKDTATIGEARTNYAAIETACRDLFYNLIVSF